MLDCAASELADGAQNLTRLRCIDEPSAEMSSVAADGVDSSERADVGWPVPASTFRRSSMGREGNSKDMVMFGMNSHGGKWATCTGFQWLAFTQLSRR